MVQIFMPGDKVKYVGHKLNNEVGTKLGVIVSRVQNGPGLVVDFGDDAYICNESSLHKLAPAKDGEEVEITRRRRRDDEE
jgi:hypothetical protein